MSVCVSLVPIVLPDPHGSVELVAIASIVGVVSSQMFHIGVPESPSHHAYCKSHLTTINFEQIIIRCIIIV